MTRFEMNDAIIGSVKKTLQAELPSLLKKDLRQVILYGSCARGDYNDDSDIDVAILTNCNRTDSKKYTKPLADLSADIAIDTYAIVNFACIPADEFESKKNKYLYFSNINRDGVSIYG